MSKRYIVSGKYVIVVNKEVWIWLACDVHKILIAYAYIDIYLLLYMFFPYKWTID